MKILIWCGMSRGGIADYVHAQAEALAALGTEVEVACPPGYLSDRAPTYTASPILAEPHGHAPVWSRFGRALDLALVLTRNAWRVARHARRTKPDILLGHFAEYMAPLWAWRFRALKRTGMRFATVLHDPVRNHVVGPLWWHRWSVLEALSYVQIAFLHDEVTSDLPTNIPSVVIPHGPYGHVLADRSRSDVRRELGIPAVALAATSFGYVRDNKNIDLVLRAMVDCPEYWLIVAGSEQKGGNRSIAYYQALADELGCANRCIWITKYLDAQEIANLFAASDLNLLTYSRNFVSASGVLATAAHYRVPSLVSGGLSALRDTVREYGIGIWVEPDDIAAIVDGLSAWRSGDLRSDWDRYERDHSWDRNAILVRASLDQLLDHSDPICAGQFRDTGRMHPAAPGTTTMNQIAEKSSR